MNNFDTIVPYYDKIAWAVFGRSIRTCQLEFIHLIPVNAEILILGGGTGWLVQNIIRQTKNVTITYLDKSPKMEFKTKSLLSKNEKSKVSFINISYENFKITKQYDVVIANFFLDLFPYHQLMDTVAKIKKQLKPNSLFLVSDFQIDQPFMSKLWQNPLLWIMHIFFKITTQLASSSLQNINKVIKENGFILKEKRLFYRKMIFSKVYST